MASSKFHLHGPRCLCVCDPISAASRCIQSVRTATPPIRDRNGNGLAFAWCYGFRSVDMISGRVGSCSCRYRCRSSSLDLSPYGPWLVLLLLSAPKSRRVRLGATSVHPINGLPTPSVPSSIALEERVMGGSTHGGRPVELLAAHCFRDHQVPSRRVAKCEAEILQIVADRLAIIDKEGRRARNASTGEAALLYRTSANILK